MRATTRTIDGQGAGVTTNRTSSADAYAAVTTPDGHRAEIIGSRSSRRNRNDTLHIKLLDPEGRLLLDILEETADPQPLTTRSGQAIEATERLLAQLQATPPDGQHMTEEAQRALEVLRNINAHSSNLEQPTAAG